MFYMKSLLLKTREQEKRNTYSKKVNQFIEYVEKCASNRGNSLSCFYLKIFIGKGLVTSIFPHIVTFATNFIVVCQSCM